MKAIKYHTGKFPPSINDLDWKGLLPLIGPANAAVARYEGVLLGIPNAQVLLSPLTSQEAVLSSKIEGTQATLGEVLEFEAAEETAPDNKRDDILEILNYRKAMKHAMEMMQTLPLSQRLIRDTHKKLLTGVRGRKKTPGKYRRIQNWIGSPGCKMEEARFIPPSADKVPILMSKWEKYIHRKEFDKLVQLAILHVEFEAIHPFLDGNGRIGRLIVPLFLVSKGLLTSPTFYISAYLEAKREEYYSRLLAVSRDGDWTNWCMFFLNALIEQANDNESKARVILDLYQKKKDWITENTHSQYAVKALDWFFSKPVFSTSDFVTSADVPKPTAYRIIRICRDKGLLREIRSSSGRQAAILVFPELVNIVEGRSIF